jgi:hypothetical protein
MIEPLADPTAPLLRCSFCGKSQDEICKLIAGPSVFICDECIDLCNDIIAEAYETSVAIARMWEEVARAGCWAFALRYIPQGPA